MRLLGIDYGKKRVGLAISDEEGRFAFPHAIIANDKRLLEVVQNICLEKGVREIVIGESRDYEGKENIIMKHVHAFKKILEEKTGLLVHLEPEFLTSRQARPVKTGPKRQARKMKAEQKRPLDDSAAAIILQSFLDKKRESNT
ncbi:Holliday junction resolvase RuvX [bacterium]|nr:Holliday junction resolvase RuvX [bacterium]|tara:strand:- start:7637 stop:8065 length:429 start_codon:yes stop_codon:yes gene_type:complete